MKAKTKSAVALIGLLLATTANAQSLQSWQHNELSQAWQQGYTGQSTTIQVVDQFNTSNLLGGDLGYGYTRNSHGDWVATQAKMTAPSATIVGSSFATAKKISLNPGLNIVNASYSYKAPGGYATSAIPFKATERSVIATAKTGAAVVVKAAGNDGVTVTAAASDGRADYLNRALVGTPSTIFVGALTRNGTPERKAQLASYSNYAGSSPAVQNQFLTVAVERSKTGLAGTSFAAPIVSGYAAIVGSKFTSATPTQIAKQLLTTARTDTIAGYNPAIHGRGEASIARALAPVALR